MNRHSQPSIASVRLLPPAEPTDDSTLGADRPLTLGRKKKLHIGEVARAFVMAERPVPREQGCGTHWKWPEIFGRYQE